MREYTGILAVQNGATFIRNAIMSMLQQELPPKTIIVSDDGSDDGTPDLVRLEFPQVKLLCNKAGGQAAAINQALSHVDTNYAAFLDHDDTWMPRKSAIQIPLLAARPDIDVIFGGVQNMTLAKPFPVINNMGACRALGASMFRRSCFARVGYFRVGSKANAIIDWWSRAVTAGIKTLEHSDIVLHRYIHGNNFGIHEKRASLATLVAQIREHNIRQRAQE